MKKSKFGQKWAKKNDFRGATCQNLKILKNTPPNKVNDRWSLNLKLHEKSQIIHFAHSFILHTHFWTQKIFDDYLSHMETQLHEKNIERSRL